MLKVIKNSGFHMTFQNGWTVSVQFGPASYSEHYLTTPDVIAKDARSWSSKNAEIAAFKDGKFYEFPVSPDHEDVKGYCSAEEVADFIHLVRNLP
jgi:hypothetical protein